MSKPCHQAGKLILLGQTIESVCGYDCKTKQPMVVRIKGEPTPPEGWESACKPKIEKSVYAIRFSGYRSATCPTYSDDAKKRIPFPSKLFVLPLEKSMALSYLRSHLHPNLQVGDDVLNGQAGGGGGWSVYENGKEIACGGLWYFGEYVSNYAHKWPSEHPPEIVYDPESKLFKNPCPDIMPLPPEYNNGKSCVLLCDGEGNTVLLKVTDKGIAIAQHKHRQTITVDPATGRAKALKLGAGTIKLSSQTTFELPRPRAAAPRLAWANRLKSLPTPP